MYAENDDEPSKGYRRFRGITIFTRLVYHNRKCILMPDNGTNQLSDFSLLRNIYLLDTMVSPVIIQIKKEPA